ncbi:DUF1572 family protein [Oceanobacillus chungangensis]|uniref:DUF1572 domain-containing protein n=1 Tax=Oceanobacillus chungangensis TaxID=1229152 RepID=A0A3D8PY10_9BACI|nr:DUF1572 family protein [Oceanobacillus chungangensis]RDW20973.1 hypothetical protein CWR45_03755 [Oceanobacillus chungangensis]
MTLGNEYLQVVQERFRSIKELGDKTIQRLSEDEIHWALNKSSNSIAIIVKHLSGNMISRWTDFLTSDGEKNNRKRDQEFIDTISSKQEMIIIWESGWNTLFRSIDNLVEEDLLKNINIRGESHMVIDAIERQIAHYAYHIGQIVYVGKQIKDEEWESLSIPKGNSEEYLQKMLKKHGKLE